MEFCHITPTFYIDRVANHPRHLVLAHLVESNPQYVEKYLKIRNDNPNVSIIMDNSAFEMYKQGKPMFETDKLIDLGRKIKADYIVLSDYPMEDWHKTYDIGCQMAASVHDAGFKTFFVPQSELNDFNGYVECVHKALQNREFDLIGLSILACPIALGLKENKYDESVSGTYRMQRFLSRWRVLYNLHEFGMLNESALRRFHMLGMTEGPHEIVLVKDYIKYIASWDSSAAVWHGINGHCFDNSPTGLANGKFEKEVDFNYCPGNIETTNTVAIDTNIRYNVDYIDQLVNRVNNV